MPSLATKSPGATRKALAKRRVLSSNTLALKRLKLKAPAKEIKSLILLSNSLYKTKSFLLLVRKRSY